MAILTHISLSLRIILSRFRAVSLKLFVRFPQNKFAQLNYKLRYGTFTKRAKLQWTKSFPCNISMLKLAASNGKRNSMMYSKMNWGFLHNGEILC